MTTLNRFYELPTELQDVIYLVNDLPEHKEKMKSVFDAIKCVGETFKEWEAGEEDWIECDLWGCFWDEMEEYQDQHYVYRKKVDYWRFEHFDEMYQVHLSIKSLGELKNKWCPFYFT